MKTLEEKFWDGVEKLGAEDCWIWTKSLTVHGGYGQFTHRRKLLKAHRVSYMLHNGDIPSGMFVCHKCNNPKCCNPNHLYAGTPFDNWHDTIKSGKAYAIPPHRGEDSYQSRFKNEDILYIRNSCEKGVALAKKYNVSKTTISAIRRGRTWKHLL